MTDLDQNKLFNDVSKAMLDDDSSKLSELLAQESPEVEEQPEEELPAEEPEEESQEEEIDTSAEEADTEQETEQAEEDPLSVLRAEIESLKKKQHEISSQSGRVSSIQRRLAEYDKKLAEFDKATSSQASAKVKPEIAEALKELEETDPVLARTIQTVMDKALGGVDSELHTKERERIAALRDEEYAEYQEEQRNILLAAVPNAREVFQSSSWSEWKKSQPKHLVDLAQSDDAQAVLLALDYYKKDMLAQHPDLGKKTQEQPTVVDERANKLEEERKRKQQNAVNLDTGKAPSRSKLPNNPEALFKDDFEKIMKEITGK